jgi:hypothetical protein
MDYRINPEPGQYWIRHFFDYVIDNNEFGNFEIIEILYTKNIYHNQATNKTIKTLHSLRVYSKDTIVYYRNIDNYVNMEWDRLSEFVNFFNYLGDKKDTERYLDEKNIKWIIE